MRLGLALSLLFVNKGDENLRGYASLKQVGYFLGAVLRQCNNSDTGRCKVLRSLVDRAAALRFACVDALVLAYPLLLYT